MVWVKDLYCKFDGKYKCCLFLNMMYQVCGMSNIHKHQLLQKDISKNLRVLSEIMSFGFFCKVLLTTKKSQISTLFSSVWNETGSWQIFVGRLQFDCAPVVVFITFAVVVVEFFGFGSPPA